MGDNDELRRLHKLLEHLHESIDVRLVQRRVDFVQHAEWAGPAAKDC
jgi:hypothetical protein